MTASPDKSESGGIQTLATNRRARHNYRILEKLEAGIALRGSEVKSIRESGVSLNEAYAKIEHGEIILHSLHVMPYRYSRAFTEDPRRPRRLLLHRHEIRRLTGKVTEKGRTLIPLKLYLKRGKVKIELGLCTGKEGRDKRDTLRRKTADRDAARAIAESKKRS